MNKEVLLKKMMPSKLKEKDVEGLTSAGAALVLISTIIGAGIVSLPFAYDAGGPVLSPILHVILVITVYGSSVLHLKSKDYLELESFAEISFKCLGRASIFIVNGLITFCTFSLIVMYMIFFSKIAQSLFGFTDFTRQRWVYVLFMFTALLPLVLKRKIHQVKFASWFLFTGVIVMVFTFISRQW